ncbi:ABC transporter substrate-binding protein [Duganella qianjiadongensis]|uniref:ABC transporter substrate-binding protein n=1 Tax=Duganella qianjiadongensis TaxID=2692176 RepID=UPI001E481F2B|nr:ABC transporter substrate binding protein [Duganella qianjiadongensis]
MLYLLLLLLPLRQAYAQGLAVLHPELNGPYRSVVSEILQGVEEQIHSHPRIVVFGPATDAVELRNNLKNSKAVIALGRQSLKLANTLDSAVPVVIGGVNPGADSEQLNGISMMPDPALLFTLLRNLLPSVRRVMAVYHPQTSEAQIRLAREAARAQGLDFSALEASDLAGAARAYEALLSTSDSRRDALWLLQDPTTVEETTILPMILKESWSRSLPVFSSSVLHVKKGVLFGMYPNHVQLGHDLAQLASALQNGENVRRGLMPLRALSSALNSRTASHLGLHLGTVQLRQFDAIFPEL